MKLVTYNIQFGRGKDERTDLARIAGEVEGADVICLQEVERFMPSSGDVDQVAAIAALLPDLHWVYGAGVDLDADVADGAGRPLHRRRQFGNMLLARDAIVSARNHLLPKYGMVEQLSLQRAALEAVIASARGPIRLYDVHLGHAARPERLRQIERLLEIVGESPCEGGVWSGSGAGGHWREVGTPPPMPRPAILLGDFNCTPDSPEYERLCGPLDRRYGRITELSGLVDGWAAAGNAEADGITCPGKGERIDYVFLTADLAPAVLSMRVDAGAQGSDHQPVWLDLNLYPGP